MRSAAMTSTTSPTVKDVLEKRLRMNEDVLQLLPEVSGAHMDIST